MTQRQPWCVLADIGVLWDIADIGAVANRLEEDEKSHDVRTGAQCGTGPLVKQQLLANQGLYRVTFESRQAGGEAFQKWVSLEVSPRSARRASHDPRGPPADGKNWQGSSRKASRSSGRGRVDRMTIGDGAETRRQGGGFTAQDRECIRVESRCPLRTQTRASRTASCQCRESAGYMTSCAGILAASRESAFEGGDGLLGQTACIDACRPSARGAMTAMGPPTSARSTPIPADVLEVALPNPGTHGDRDILARRLWPHVSI